MSQEQNKRLSQTKLQQETAKALFEKCHHDKTGLMDLDVLNPEKVKSLCYKHAELLNDFRAVKEMNRVMSDRFDQVLDRFPLLAEVDCLLANLGDLYSESEDRETYYLREKKLKSFRKIVESQEKHNENIRPKSYDESVETQEVENDD